MALTRLSPAPRRADIVQHVVFRLAHVHVLIETRAGHRLDRTVYSWKSFTAKAADRFLGRGGPFWAPEYFDRYMRDDAHLAATRDYIEANPVKAGLCRAPFDWPSSSASRR